jgi:hypothetical protein
MYNTGHNFHYCHNDSTQASASNVPFNLDNIGSLKIIKEPINEIFHILED